MLISRRERAPLVMKLAFGVRTTKSATSRNMFFWMSAELNAEMAIGTSFRLCSRCWAVTTISSRPPSWADATPWPAHTAAIARGRTPRLNPAFLCVLVVALPLTGDFDMEVLLVCSKKTGGAGARDVQTFFIVFLSQRCVAILQLQSDLLPAICSYPGAGFPCQSPFAVVLLISVNITEDPGMRKLILV